MGEFADVELGDVELADDTLLLRRWRADDAPRVHEIMQDRSMYEFLALPDPYTADAAHEFVTVTGHEGRDTGTGLGCAVVERTSGRVVGAAALRLADGPELGYWIAPDARGHGHAAHAVSLLCAFAFGRLDRRRVSLACDVRNLASVRTAMRAGFRFEGVVRDGAPGAAYPVGDLAWFGRLAGDPGEPLRPAFPSLPRGGLSDGVVTLRIVLPQDAIGMDETDDEVAGAVGFGGPKPSLRDQQRAADRAGLDRLVGARSLLAIVDDATGEYAGSVTLRFSGPPDIGGIGYGVHPRFRGRHYTARALRLLAPWAFEHGFARLELGAKDVNIASQRAAEAAGFEPDGIRRHRLRNRDGTYSDEVRYCLLPPSAPNA